MREASLVWTAPVQLVTYFRYIRFFDNGQCLSLLTTMEPREVVHAVYRGTKLGGVQCGRWNLEEQGALHVTTRGPADYMFHMDLKVKSSGRGRLNKLAWYDCRYFTSADLDIGLVSGGYTPFQMRSLSSI